MLPIQRRHPGRPGGGEREGAYVARLADDSERVGEAAEQRVRIALPVRDGAADRGLPVSLAIRRMLAIKIYRWPISDCNGDAPGSTLLMTPMLGCRITHR